MGRTIFDALYLAFSSAMMLIQVRMMDTIYSTANIVIVWLSSSRNDSDIMEVGPHFGWAAEKPGKDLIHWSEFVAVTMKVVLWMT